MPPRNQKVPALTGNPWALMDEARGILPRCADPGRLVTTWLAEEQGAEAARTRQEGLFEPLTGSELTILRMLPARARCASSQPSCLSRPIP